MPLTDRVIRSARPGTKLSDDDGSWGTGRLILSVSPRGRKIWVFRGRTAGRDHTRKLGDYPTLSLSDARAAARALNRRPDPMRRGGTLGELLKAYVASLRARGAGSARATELQFRRSVPDSLLAKEARSITTSDIAAVLRAKARRGATTSVNRLRAALSAAFNFAARHDHDPRGEADDAVFLIEGNPVLGTPRVSEWERVRDRVLTLEECVAFWDAMNAREDPIGCFWLAVLLTGQRVEQLLHAQHEGQTLVLIDRKGRSPKPRRHVVPLTPLLSDLWNSAQHAHMAGINAVRHAAAIAMPEGAVPMDIRRTVETLLMECGVNRDLRGALLSHGRSGVQARHYERAEMIDQKLGAMLILEKQILTP